MKASWKEMWLEVFCINSSPILDVKWKIHVNETGDKAMMPKNIDVCWHGTSFMAY